MSATQEMPLKQNGEKSILKSIMYNIVSDRGQKRTKNELQVAKGSKWMEWNRGHIVKTVETVRCCGWESIAVKQREALVANGCWWIKKVRGGERGRESKMPGDGEIKEDGGSWWEWWIMYGQDAHDLHSTLACPLCPTGSQAPGEDTSACQLAPVHLS